MSPSPHGFDAYCRRAETGGTVERVCVALDVGLEMHDAFDARRPDGPTRLAVVLPALRTWITQKTTLAPKTQWGLVVLRDAEAELLLAPTERDIMLATLNSVAQPLRKDAFEEEDDGVALCGNQVRLSEFCGVLCEPPRHRADATTLAWGT